MGMNSKNDKQELIQKKFVSKNFLNFFALLRMLSPGKPSSGVVRGMGPMSNENIDNYLSFDVGGISVQWCTKEIFQFEKW